jgi:hypothetical protein
MQIRALSVVFSVLCFTFASFVAGAQTQVLHYKSSAKLRIAGKDHLVVIAEFVKSTRMIRLVVPNRDPDGDYAPMEDQGGVVKGLGANDLIQASWTTDQQVNSLITLDRYIPKPGELTPHGYVFVRTEPAKENSPELVMVLDKLGEKTRAAIPRTPDAAGELRCDPVIQAVVAKLHEGDPVYAELSAETEPKLLVLMPYADPRQGKLLCLQAADIDGDKGVSVEIDAAGETVTALLPGKTKDGKWVTDARLLASTRRCKLNSPCLFRIQIIEGKTWLRQLDPVPEQPVAHAAPPPRGGGNTDANGLPRPRIPGGGVPGVGGVGF